MALGLIKNKVQAGTRVALLMDNCPEWIITDLAVSSIGCVSVPLYTTLSAADKKALIKDSGASILVYGENHENKIRPVLDGNTFDKLELLVTTSDTRPAQIGNLPCLTLDELTSSGKACSDNTLLKKRIEQITPDDPFSIIYSSGTTGRAKGVVLTHANLLSNIQAVSQVIPFTTDDLYLSYLPISHVFERMVHHLLIEKGTAIAYSSGFAYVGADVHLFRPSFMTGVPFFFEKVKAKILDGVEKAGGFKKAIFERAMNSRGKPGMFERMALNAVREKAVPGVKFFISGGAALAADTARFFGNLGLPVLQGYGLTETSPVVTVNTLEANRLGTVGRPLPGVDVKLSESGEILVKGPSVMQGYLNMPEETSRVIRDGWFHTGDTGIIDSDGFLTINGRAKDLIITSLGKNISPQRIEMLLKSDKYIKQAVVFGDGRAHLTALIMPEPELEVPGVTPAGGNTRKQTIEKFFEGRVKNALADLSRFEQIRRFAIITDELSTEGGELTATLKVRRSVVAERYKTVIESLYDRK